MAIGDLYNANNVVVGQAACFVAPPNTPLPLFTSAVLSDPFSYAPWTGTTFTVGAATAGSFVLAYTFNGTVYTIGSLPYNATKTAVQTAINAVLGANVAVVSGAAPSWAIALPETWVGGAWTITPTGLTGGAAAVVNGLWTPAGGTNDGWKYSTAKTTQDLFLEEQSSPIATTMNSQKVTIEGSLAEDISRTLALAYNATIAVTAPGVGQPGLETVTLTDTILNYSVALVTQHFNGLPRWIYAPLWTQLANVQTSFRRSAAYRMYPVSFSTICKTSQIQTINFTAAGS